MRIRLYLDQVVLRLENDIIELKIVEKYLAENMAEPLHRERVAGRALGLEKKLERLKAEYVRFSQMMETSAQAYRNAYTNVFSLMGMERSQIADQSLSGLESIVEIGPSESACQALAIERDAWNLVASRQGRWDHFSSFSKSVIRSCPRCRSELELRPFGTKAAGQCAQCLNEYILVDGVLLLITAGRVSCGNCGNDLSSDGILNPDNVCCLKCKRVSPRLMIGTQVHRMNSGANSEEWSNRRDWVTLGIDHSVDIESVAYTILCDELHANVIVEIGGHDVLCRRADAEYVRTVIADYERVVQSRIWREASDNFIKSGTGCEYIRVMKGIPMGVLVGHLRKAGLSISAKYELDIDHEYDEDPLPFILKVSSEYVDAAIHEILRYGRDNNREIDARRIVHE